MFKLANNGWKLNHLTSTTYPAWWKRKLDENSRWKEKGKGIKVEDNDDDDDNNSDEVSMKCGRALACKSEIPEKKFKGVCCIF